LSTPEVERRQLVDCGPHRRGGGEHRRDVLEQDAGLREVGNVAQELGQVHAGIVP
jgi:hypothetical protein